MLRLRRTIVGIGVAVAIALGGGYYAVADCPFGVALEVADELRCLTRGEYEDLRDGIFTRVLSGWGLSPEEYQLYFVILDHERRKDRVSETVRSLDRKTVENTNSIGR